MVGEGESRRVAATNDGMLSCVPDLSDMRKQYHFWPSAVGDGFDAWDVDRLIALAAELPVEQVDVESIDEVDSVYWFDDVQRPTVRAVIEHARLIDEVDASHPIILGPDGRVMDGMHRIARALRDGRSHVDARRLPTLPPPDHRNARADELPYERD
ncbi:MAG: hypothetical protein QNJ12_02170 [Ilumatobacter sp.]|uniref:hypothetical protein n=1 Tax=Ilumatobacter sp. TaxID=1967498 RepID=UPI00262277DB|nr:hypothetical protein [Ilumatobacter sp.]MDJ0767562.1 hypothetical protein [Ilumatobacter sp.]